tara:strand:+ start:214 stop:2148 length:1935 start_codon:yes stop_codon:yes gene_type:complete
MPDHYMDDIYSDINRKKQLEDAQENKEFDRDIEAYRRGKENLTDEEKIDRLKDAARKKRLYNDISGSINGFEEAKKDPNLVKELQGIGFETAVNVATDSLTTWLGWAPPVYAVVNFLSAGGANLVAQKKIRGEENINWGEAWASAGLGTIPFMNPAAGKLTKVVGKPQTIKRAVVGGGLTGVGYQQIEAGINERRVISPTEAALGFATGGVVSGTFKGTTDLGKRIIDQIHGVMPMGKLAYGVGAGESPLNPRSAKRRSIYGETFKRARTSIAEPELESLENELVLNWGMKDRTFRWDQYKSRIADKSKGRADKRKLGAMFESVPFTKVNYEVIAAQRMPELRKFYGPLFTDIGLKPRDFQLHHQKPILASLPGYDGLRFGSDEWWDVTEILFKNGLRPGDHERNLKPLVGGSKPSRKNITNKKVLDTQGRFETPHSVTHKYLDTQVGDDGTLFWTQDVRDRMNGVGKWEGKGPDHQFRKDKWDEYAQIVRKSIDITDQAEQTFIDLYRRDPKLKNVPTDPQELDLIIERLAKLEEDGLVNPEIIEGSWQVNQMETIVSEVTEELQKSQADYNWRAVFGRDGLMQRFVDKREITNKELRLLKDLPLGEQLEALQKYTGMTIEDINLLIETRPNFDPIRFIKEHR